MSASETTFEALRSAPEGSRLDPARVAAVFDALPAVAEPSFLLGSWRGGSLDTGHPVHGRLAGMRWAGKDFRSEEDVTPIVVYDGEGGRVASAEFGEARIRQVVFRGKTSAAMVYDKFAIIDSFRRVDDQTVMGAMDSKDLAEAGVYYFYLSRL